MKIKIQALVGITYLDKKGDITKMIQFDGI